MQLKNTALILLIVISQYAHAQFSNSAFFSSYKLYADSNLLSLKISNTNFLKNNEYFNKIVQGYTLIGFHLQPRLVYQPASKVRIEGGIHLQKYSGLNQFTQVRPVFTVNYQPFRWLNLVMGTLYGALNHRMAEPLFDFERHYTQNVENGLQVLISHDLIHSDLWLTWEKFIFRHSEYQEEFVFGNSTRLNVLNKSRKVILQVPVQFLFAHKGGQGLNMPDHHIETLMNVAYGVSFGVRTNKKFISEITLNGLLTHYRDLSPLKYLKYDNGYAFYPYINVEGKFLEICAAYWDARHFIAPRGEAMYQCVSSEDSVYKENHRKLLTMKLGLKYEIIKGIDLGARFEGYYCLNKKHFDFSYSLYLVLNREILIKRINNFPG